MTQHRPPIYIHNELPEPREPSRGHSQGHSHSPQREAEGRAPRQRPPTSRVSAMRRRHEHERHDHAYISYMLPFQCYSFFLHTRGDTREIPRATFSKLNTIAALHTISTRKHEQRQTRAMDDRAQTHQSRTRHRCTTESTRTTRSTLVKPSSPSLSDCCYSGLRPPAPQIPLRARGRPAPSACPKSTA